MTKKLFWNNPYIYEFDAMVEQLKETPEGVKLYLDQTAFYPESGGQIADKGTINGIDVIDVQEDEYGNIYHILKEKPIGNVLHGEIDYNLRLRNMQQHTGQHILSESFVQMYGFQTVGFHMGADYCSIDLDTISFNDEKIAKALKLANSIVWENRKVKVKFYNDDEINAIKLRKTPKIKGEIRVVEIEGFDRSACGGTHLSSTGEVGLIMIIKTEKMKNKTRVFFACGSDALNHVINEHSILMKISKITTTGINELPGKIEKTLSNLKALEKSNLKLKNDLLESNIPTLLDKYESDKGISVVCEKIDGDAQSARFLCLKLIGYGRKCSAVCASEKKKVLFIGRSHDIDLDLNDLARVAREKFSVKGGGKPDFIQLGGGSENDFKDVFDFCSLWLKEKSL